MSGKRVTAVYLVPEGYERVEDDNGYVVIVKKGTQAGASEELPEIDFYIQQGRQRKLSMWIPYQGSIWPSSDRCGMLRTKNQR